MIKETVLFQELLMLSENTENSLNLTASNIQGKREKSYLFVQGMKFAVPFFNKMFSSIH